jgi:hypothetical protein
MAKRLICIYALVSFCSGEAVLNYNLPLDRPYTLRNASPQPLERESGRQIRSAGPFSFIFPRPCLSALDSGTVCGGLHGFQYLDSARGRALSVSPIGGYEYRYSDENVNAFDGGVLTTGASGPVSFYLDARMFTETHERFDHRSFDREFVERQDEKASGTVAYSSFSRFRSNLSYDLPWGRFTVARDAAHWGPGLFTNLSFNANAIPFNQLTFTTHLGPLSVQSLYGRLALDTNWETDTTGDTRSIYAHRYEWRATPNLLLGISEQLVLHKREAPFAFVPIVPLYIAKAAENEHLNNGNIAGDAAYRIPGIGLLYTEFLIDDLQSPTALFNDYWGNKWGWMIGGHWVGEWAGRDFGCVGEYSRVEPWVYTHKEPRTAQTAHFNQPLGNPLGPNSQAVILKGYLRQADSWYLSTRIDLTWKGTDPGSSIDDIQRDEATKSFLAGVEEPDWMVHPYVWYRWNHVAAFCELGFGTRVESRLGAQLQY